MFGNLNQLINFNYRKINQIDWNTFDCLQVVVVFVFFLIELLINISLNEQIK